MDADRLASELRDARERTLALVSDLDDAQWMGPRLRIVNPFLWELGHVGWFQERWVLRRARGLVDRGVHLDPLYDSSRVPHDARWDLPLPSRADTLAYLAEVLERVLDGLARGVTDDERYFATLALFHEDMHGEAFAMTRQTLGYPCPFRPVTEPAGEVREVTGDARVPAGVLRIGAERGQRDFLFDNEKWAHEVSVPAFAIARAPVTQGDFAGFVDDGGYARRALWSDAGWAWRCSVDARAPVYWRREGRTWLRRSFDALVPLEPALPMVHACWYEAAAYCAWAGRRLPTEAEWERAASVEPGTERRRAQPWGDEAPSHARANLDATRGGLVPVHALAAGDSALGLRQAIGNVWEWTATDFLPFPGFGADPYEDYSRPWFGTHKVMKGGSFVTRARMVRPGFRNFYTPDRRDVFAGFRTCAP